MSLPESEQPLERLAELLQRRNEIDRLLSQLIGRPASPGHVGEFIAAEIFDIQLHISATTKASDGVFQAGPLAGQTVNVKLYGKRESCLDIGNSPVAADHPNFYLVMTGPRGSGATSRGSLLTFAIEGVYLFASHELLAEQLRLGVKLGDASSMLNNQWQGAMIYPDAVSSRLVLDDRQRLMLSRFASSAH